MCLLAIFVSNKFVNFLNGSPSNLLLLLLLMELNFLLVATYTVNPHYLFYLTIKFHHQLSVKISTQVCYQKKVIFFSFSGYICFIPSFLLIYICLSLFSFLIFTIILAIFFRRSVYEAGYYYFYSHMSLSAAVKFQKYSPIFSSLLLALNSAKSFSLFLFFKFQRSMSTIDSMVLI